MSHLDSAVGVNEIDGAELPDYRPLCIPAIVGCVVGVLSFLALLHPVLWFVPLIGIGVNAYAFMQLASSDRMIGRRAAQWGIFLSLLFGAAAPLRTLTYQWLERRDAQQTAREWFEAVREGNLYKAHQLGLMPGERRPLDDQLPKVYEQSADLQAGLDSYSKTPVVATLRALGPQAMVRHYQTESVQSDGRQDLVEDVYAVTYDERGQKKTFFIKMSLWRSLRADMGPRLWRVQNPEGGYKPKGWE
jgi:hypothetical protein